MGHGLQIRAIGVQKVPTVVPIYYYHLDHLGTSTALTDFNGSTYQFFLNLPFGETMAQQLGNNYYNSPYKFNGKELDEETGLYYYGARYYDPRTSTWLSVDPLAEKYQNVNPYVYTIDNPINLIDPDGKESTKPPLWKRVKDDFRYDLNQVKNNIKYALIKLDKMIESIPTEKNDKLQGNSQGHFKEGLNYIKSDANDPKNKRGLETANSAKNVDNADADFFDLFEGGIKMSSTSKAFEKVINTVDKVVAAKEKIQEGKENNASEYVQTVKDTKNPNNNRWVKKDFLDSQKKNKNEN